MSDPKRSVSHHPPTEGPDDGAESREETIARVTEDGAAPEPVTDASLTEDPSTRRGISRLLAIRWIGWGFVAGAAVGAAIAAVVWFVFDDDVLGGDAGRIGVTIGIVLGAAAIGAIFSGLVNLAREDGRIQREIKQDHPSADEGPGDGGSPRTDPPDRSERS